MPPVARPSTLHKLFTDGACRGNPGPSTAGAALFSPDGNLLATSSKRLGVMSNNAAEYNACIYGLKLAHLHNVQRVIVLSDSLLLVRQMSGLYRTSNPILRLLKVRLGSLASACFDVCAFAHVLRSENVLADALANEAFHSDKPIEKSYGPNAKLPKR